MRPHIGMLAATANSLRSAQRIVARVTMPVAQVRHGKSQTPIFHRVHGSGATDRVCPLCNTPLRSEAAGCSVCSSQRTNLGLVEGQSAQSVPAATDDRTRVLFICGMDAQHDTEYYSHLISHLASLGCTVCSFDNRCAFVSSLCRMLCLPPLPSPSL